MERKVHHEQEHHFLRGWNLERSRHRSRQRRHAGSHERIQGVHAAVRRTGSRVHAARLRTGNRRTGAGRTGREISAWRRRFAQRHRETRGRRIRRWHHRAHRAGLYVHIASLPAGRPHHPDGLQPRRVHGARARRNDRERRRARHEPLRRERQGARVSHGHTRVAQVSRGETAGAQRGRTAGVARKDRQFRSEARVSETAAG